MRFFIAPLMILALGACAKSVPLRSTATLRVVEGASVMPAPTRSDLTPVDRPVLIGAFDVLDIDVFNVPEITRSVQVDGNGRMALPLIGTIDVSGKSAQDLEREIEAGLRTRYVRDPEVTINVKNAVSQVVTVDGQVLEPGLYPVTNQMTLMRAIASAKGLSEFARLNDVVILRTVNGQRMAGLYNIGAIRRGAYEDPPVYANDVIVVGDSPQRRMFRDIATIAPLLVSPLITILQ